MRVSKERQDSTIRVTKLEVAIFDALESLSPEESRTALQELEVIEALTNVSNKLVGGLRRAQIEETE